MSRDYFIVIIVVETLSGVFVSCNIKVMFYTYVLKSKRDNLLYIGHTDNLKNRYKKHNEGLVESTKNRRPLELIYYEACLDIYKAIKREKYFKTGFGRRFLKERI